MKKSLLAILIIGMAVSACKKNDTTTLHTTPAAAAPGTWIFKNVIDTVTTCSGSNRVLTATNGTISNPTTTAHISFNFAGPSLPTTPGQYQVVNGYSTLTATQVVVNLGSNSSSDVYSSNGGNGAQYITVSISNGKLTLVGTGINLINNSNVADSSSLLLNITQLQ